jgi:hypothetical protein
MMGQSSKHVTQLSVRVTEHLRETRYKEERFILAQGFKVSSHPGYDQWPSALG